MYNKWIVRLTHGNSTNLNYNFSFFFCGPKI